MVFFPMNKPTIDQKSPFDIEDEKQPFLRAQKPFLEQWQENRRNKTPRFALRTHAIIASPPELRGCDPMLARELDENRFPIAGRFIEFDAAIHHPFLYHPVSVRWETELHRFDWLRHFSALPPEDQDTPDYSLFYAQNFVKGFLKGDFDPDHMTWHPDIVSRRLINWLTHSDIILPSKKGSLHKKIMRSFGEQLHLLSKNYKSIPVNYSKMQAAQALLFGGLSIAGQASLYDKFMPRYLYELTTQILPDGSHISRNPETLAHLILDLLQIRTMLETCKKAPHQRIEEKLPLMYKALRFMRLGDGKLARFNGVCNNYIEEITYCLYRDKTRLPIGHELPDAHYFRLASGDSLLIADGGKAPPAHAGQKAQASATSFEFSAGIHPIIINSGLDPFAEEKDYLYTRSTRAHSTVVLSDYSSARMQTISPKGYPESLDILIGPPEVNSTLTETEDSQTLKLSHTGFVSVGGIKVQRTLTLTKNGFHLNGEERLIRVNNATLAQNSVATLFHIHPNNHVERLDSRAALITLPDGEQWRFTVTGAKISLSESTFYDADEPLISTLLTMNGPQDTNEVVQWELVSVSHRKKSALTMLD